MTQGFVQGGSGFVTQIVGFKGDEEVCLLISDELLDGLDWICLDSSRLVTGISLVRYEYARFEMEGCMIVSRFEF
jgi:hypothetical protein